MPDSTPQPLSISTPAGPVMELDPSSALDLRRVLVGAVDLSPGLAIVDDGDPRIWHALQGFMFTAGPDHIRHPEPTQGGRGRYPLHGSLPSHPATQVLMEEGEAGCRAVIPVVLADGGAATLHRRWHIEPAGTVCLEDRLANTGAAPFAPMMLYHMNIAGQLLDDGTTLAGAMLDGGGFRWDFREDPGGVFCVDAATTSDAAGMAHVSLGPILAIGGMTLTVSFDTAMLPWLQIWRCRRDGVNVLGLEPCTHRWKKRDMLSAAGELPLLQPGEEKHYGLRFSFSHGDATMSLTR